MPPPNPAVGIQTVHFPHQASPAERTSAFALAEATGATANPVAHAKHGVLVALAQRKWRAIPVSSSKLNTPGWIWIRLRKGEGEILSDEGALLYCAVGLVARGLPEAARSKLEKGIFLPASFGWHRTHFDGCLTQYWRSVRNFDPEQYVATVAESGFTHLEVNGLQAHMPYEDTVSHEYYPQFYTYAAGFNHFVATPLTEGLWPAMYLEANLNNLKRLAALGRKYGLRPGLCMFEPRSMPERLFQRYPTLRGARVDHPFRSRLPRYCLAQDHPVSQAHYRAAIQELLRAVPDLSYLSLWTNDSGAGFEHTASLYVGRNGGPYLIREWRNHDKVAAAAGASIGRFLGNLRQAAAGTHPDFDVILRIEPFKVEHEHIKRTMGGHISWEAPSLLVRGYSLPYSHPRYPDQPGVAGSVFHVRMDPAEKKALRESRRRGTEPVLNYSANSLMNHEPLLGIPFPRSLHVKLLSMRETGLVRASALGGLGNTSRSPYWPNPAAIRAAQFFPQIPIEEVLREEAARFVGAQQAGTLVGAWSDFEEIVMRQPSVPLFTGFGFCWQRTWDRPFVPDMEAIPEPERAYYEKHGCFQHNNPGLFDLGKDVLFELITKDCGAKAAGRFDANVLPALNTLIADLERAASGAAGPSSAAVFRDLKDRARAYQCWCTTLRNVCAWCAHVYGFLDAAGEPEKRSHEKALQKAIDLELKSTRELIDLLESTTTEVLIVSGAGNNTFLYGEDLPELLKRKIELTVRYRDRKPRIPSEVLWKPVPGTQWPVFR